MSIDSALNGKSMLLEQQILKFTNFNLLNKMTRTYVSHLNGNMLYTQTINFENTISAKIYMDFLSCI